MRTIHLDFETRSPLDLGKVGAWRYSRDPKTEIICLGWAIGDDPVEIWTPWLRCPKALRDELELGALVEGHNVGFERLIWEIAVSRHGFPEIGFSRWRCSMARAATRGLPQSLEGLAKALGLQAEKDLDGWRAMKKASLPIKKGESAGLFEEPEYSFDESPALLRRVYDYCRRDVETERAASKLLPELDQRELEIWQLDQEINDRGIKIDRKLCENAVRFIAQETAKLSKELIDITDGAVGAHTEIDKIKRFIKSRGLPSVTLDEKTVSKLLALSDIDPIARRVLEIRQSAGRSSVAKFGAMLESADPDDDRVRDTLRYHGAQPGRWAGKGIQVQNFPRGEISQVDELADLFAAGDFEDLELLFGDPIAAAVSALRPSLIAETGKKLLVWDFAQIEARILAWYAGCDSLVESFARGEDVYKLFAARAFGRDIGQITKGERFIGKTCILGLGYSMGAAKLCETFARAGIPVGLPTAKRLVDVYRGGYPEIPELWRTMESFAKRALTSPNPIADRFGAYERSGRFLLYWLPSGRSIAYLDPKIEDDRIVYKKALGKGLARDETYGGKLVENVIQGLARDILAEGMLRLKASGFSLIATVHDEIVAEEPDTDADEGLDIGKDILNASPSWCSAPLAVEGFIARRYRK